MTAFLIIYIILGLIAAPLSYGMSLAYWWNEFPRLQSEKYAFECIVSSALCAFYGFILPINLLSFYILTNCARHGLLFANPAKYL